MIGSGLSLAHGCSGSFHNGLETFRGCCGGVDDGTAQLGGKGVGVDLIALLVVEVALVQCNHYGHAKFQKLRGKEQASAQVGSVHDVDDGIGIFILYIGAGDAFFGSKGRHGICAGKVNCDELLTSVVICLPDGMFLLVNGNACPVADFFIAAGQCVVHRGFAGVGIAGQRDSHMFSSRYMKSEDMVLPDKIYSSNS